MFLATVYCSFLILKLCLCVRVSQENNITDTGEYQKTIVEGLTSKGHFTTASEEENASTYRNLYVNDSMEEILLVKNGTVVKSAFIPLVTGELIEKNVTQIRKQAKDLSHSKNLSPGDVIVKNGKKYRIVKVRKPAGNSKMERRSFKLIPNLLSIIPVKWMTKGQKEMNPNEIQLDNGTEWSILTTSENPKKNSENNLKRVHNSEKIQKILNLFTIVKFDNGGCYADGIKGTCLHESECQSKGGSFTATCAGDLGVCCYFERTCGEVSNENCTYFINEGFPDPSTAAPKVCTLTIEKSHQDIKQLRLDFLIFQLKEPTNGTCLHDRLAISGQNTNDNVPDICGANTGQHIYIDIEDSNGPYNLNVITVGEYFPRNFRIKVTQLGQQDPLLAPKNCLQYYADPTGYIQTFNYQHDVNPNVEVFNGYLNNLNYAICIKKLSGFCSVSYENEEEESAYPSFQLVNVDEEGERLLPPWQAGAETFDCPDDYIIVNGIRLCGEKLNDATTEIDYTKNYPVTDTSNGPFILSVKTDAAVSGRGFYLKYTQHPCLF